MPDPVFASSFHAQVIELLREMAGSLSQSKAAILSSSLADLEFQTERQRLLCQRWAALRSLAQRLPVRIQATPDAATAVMETSQRLRIYASLVRRARRTVAIFCRVLATSGVTYSPPPGARLASP